MNDSRVTANGTQYPTCVFSPLRQPFVYSYKIVVNIFKSYYLLQFNDKVSFCAVGHSSAHLF
jgi:hypothetical protein